ncbi:twin-arginine translocase subunit TatA [Tamilnaduibacter salinus]|uniref:Sec-independent protein translocase protein TatA n=1 Tax=Tamilnaduibacter salinus TaxID=1484056 RepID=A0A2A2I130_9GAMM|nr:Sec-independent protein translocase subunit TatA [Tamilnaduibacter salinus]PAV25357.1 twin-arginine translocase subunit TatA [Tamilnaduibacter salinus]
MGISIWQLLIVLGIVVLLFGTKKLRTMGTDLGGAIRGFKKSMSDEESDSPARQEDEERRALDEAETKDDARTRSPEDSDTKTPR